MYLKFIWNEVLNTNFFMAAVTLMAVGVAYQIGVRQNDINGKIGNIQDTVELYTVFSKTVDKDGKIIKQQFFVQNVGTRVIYLDKYVFNGKVFEVHGQVIPPTINQAAGGYYWVDLPSNGENHVSLVLEYSDIDGRKWRSNAYADFINGDWNVKNFKRQEIINN